MELKRERVVAISALPGMGKTYTAIKFADEYKANYTNIFWVNAENTDSINTSFEEIAELLNLPESNKNNKPLVVINAVKNWLEKKHEWLLIFDNAIDLTSIKKLFPKQNGSILLTTSLSYTGNIAKLFPLPKLDYYISALLILQRCKRIEKNEGLESADEEDKISVLAIAEEMDGLPLALDQAGAYIEETGITPKLYLDRFNTTRLRLLETRDKLVSDHPSVAATFTLAFDQLVKKNKASADLLIFCALLYHNAIPEEIIIKGKSFLGENLNQIQNDTDLDLIIKEAGKFSLVKRNQNYNKTRLFLSMHKLVRDVLKLSLKSGDLHLWINRVIKAVNLTYPTNEYSQWDLQELLLPQSRICLGYISENKLNFLEAAALLSKTGLYLYRRARYKESEVFYKESLSILRVNENKDILGLTTVLNNFGELYLEIFEHSKAEPYIKEAFELRNKYLEPNHHLLGVADCKHNCFGPQTSVFLTHNK